MCWRLILESSAGLLERSVSRAMFFDHTERPIKGPNSMDARSLLLYVRDSLAIVKISP